jgi:hypothetical protein
MRRRLDDRYELDDDPARVDVDVTHAFLTGSYWAEGRTRETVERLVSHAARVIGIYRDGKMVGFCRVESDEVTFASLLDVFVLPGHEGWVSASSSFVRLWNSARMPICHGIWEHATHTSCTSASDSVPPT